jgi:glucose/arabinose dehydrogenase
MEFLPSGKILVSEMGGKLKLLDENGAVLNDITGVPEVVFEGQGGLGDIKLHPRFEQNQLLYFSYAEKGTEDLAGATVARAKLTIEGNSGSLNQIEVIWRQIKTNGRGHYGHRITFGPDGYLWISSGDMQKFNPAQDMQSNLGKIIRLNDDGSLPTDNPFPSSNPVTSEIWSLGHRNPLGLSFDKTGRLWEVEMGPWGGDELNLVRRGANYGYPIVSNGDHYTRDQIPDHDTRHDFYPPEITWTPVISPSSMIFYEGDEFKEWKGNALIGSLSAKGVVRVKFNGDRANEIERFEMETRIRAIGENADGAIWLLEDGRPIRKEKSYAQGGGRLLKLTAVK